MATALSISNVLVTPTENDVYGAGSAGDGRILQELYLQKQWRWSMGSPGCIISGFTVPTSDADLTATIAAGSAIVAGYYVVTASTTSITVSATVDTHCWLALPIDGNDKVTSAYIYTDTTTVGGARPAAPSSSYAGAVYLGFITSDADNITGGEDHRPQGRVAWGTLKSTGSYVTDCGSGDWTVTYGSGYWTVTFASAWLRVPVVTLAECGSSVSDFPHFDRTNSSTTTLRIYPGDQGVSCFMARL